MATAALERKNTRTATFAFLGALAMLGLGYAAVPLYQLFCQVTGFGENWCIPHYFSSRI